MKKRKATWKWKGWLKCVHAEAVSTQISFE
jgi:hypothetical protein